MIHKDLSKEKWFSLSLIEQLANIGTEVSRSIKWRKKKKIDSSQKAFYRSLELLLLTKQDPKNHTHRLRELCRLYEVLVDYFDGENMYGSSDLLWEKYFLAYNYAARVKM